MIVDKILADRQFGHLYIKTHARATRYTFRPAKDGTPEQGLLVTVPVGYRLEDVLRSVEEMRGRLAALFVKSAASGQPARTQHIDWDFKILSDCLRVTLVKGNGETFSLKHDAGEIRKDEHGWVEVVRPAQVQLICPADCDFDAEGRQAWLEKVLVEAVRTHAKHQLIPRMKDLARRYGIGLKEVKINNSKGHWGSCGRHKNRLERTEYFNINLSLYTLLLPLPVQRLILLHELCHTRHMDHSAAFHRDLNVWLNGQEQALEERLKGFTTTIFAFAAGGGDV